MDEMQFIGYLVTALITLGGFFAVIQKLTQPVNDLKIVIQELKDCINTLKENSKTQDRRLTKHGEEIDLLKEKVGNIETKMNIYHN